MSLTEVKPLLLKFSKQPCECSPSLSYRSCAATFPTPPTSLKIDMEAVAAVVACNTPLRAFATGPGSASQSSLHPSMWTPSPLALGTVHNQCMASTTQKCVPQSAHHPTARETPSSIGSTNANIEFKVTIWPFVVSTINIIYTDLIPLIAYKKDFLLIPCTCFHLYTTRFCCSHPDIRRKLLDV